MTAGLPLGLEDAQIRLVHGSKKPVPPPPSVRTWYNFAAGRDAGRPQQKLNGDCRDITIQDGAVNLPGIAPMEHALDGYLALPVVKAVAIRPGGS